MTMLSSFRAGDLEFPHPVARIASEAMDGRWSKTNEAPQWIDSLVVETKGDELYVHIHGSSAPSPKDWGRVRADEIFGTLGGNGDARAGGFIAHYDFPDMQVEVQANLNLGLLVVATFVQFKQPGPMADRFTREFFWR